jgi:hypothetical protein
MTSFWLIMFGLKMNHYGQDQSLGFPISWLFWSLFIIIYSVCCWPLGTKTSQQTINKKGSILIVRVNLFFCSGVHWSKKKPTVGTPLTWQVWAT